MIYWYDRRGKVIADSNDDHKKHMADMKSVEAKLGDTEYKIIAQDYTPHKKFWISTVWLGLDQDFGAPRDKPNPKPIIFESMVFRQRHGKKPQHDDMMQRRYSTEKEANAGHAKLLAEWSDLEYRHSFRGHADKAWRAFWQKKASWNRAFGYAFAGAWLASLSSYRLNRDHNHTTQLAVLDIFVYGTMFAWMIYNGIRWRRIKKEMKNDLLELKIRSIVLELLLSLDGEGDAADRIAKARKEFLNRL